MIQPHIPKAGRGPKRVDDRRVLNGIFCILRTGAPWRDLPDRYGPRTTVYNRYARWARRGIWKSIFEAFASQNEDSLFFIGRSCGGRTSKVHAAVDESARPRCLIITGGQVHDIKVMIDLWDGAGESTAVVADKAYNSRSIHQMPGLNI